MGNGLPADYSREKRAGTEYDAGNIDRGVRDPVTAGGLGVLHRLGGSGLPRFRGIDLAKTHACSEETLPNLVGVTATDLSPFVDWC